MRGGVNTWFFIIFLALLLVVIYVMFSLPNASAITRGELDALKEKEKTLENNIADADQRLTGQKDKINEQDKTLSNLKQKLRNVNGTNWNAQKSKIDLEIKISNTVQKLKEFRDELGKIIQDKSDWIKEIKSLDIENQKIDRLVLPDLAPKIGIKLSKNCETMLKNNMTTNCISYKNIITLDSSDTYISGKFVTDNGFFHRTKGAVNNDCHVYPKKQFVIFVDPSQHCINRIKIITIENNFETYTVPGERVQHEEYNYVDYIVNKTYGNKTEFKTIQILNKTQDFGRVLYHYRWIDDNCRTATLNAANVTKMLADTIHFMRSDCDESQTSFITKEIIPIVTTPQDYTTTQDYAEKEFLKYVKEFCIFKFKAC